MTRRAISKLSILALSISNLALFIPMASGQSTWGPSALVGDSSGNDDTMTCPSGKFAIGIQVYAGIYVHGMQLECATLGANGVHQSPVLTNSMLGAPKSGTTVRQMRCASGKVMVGFKGRGGMWIDQVAIGCKSWSAAGGGTQGSVTWTSPAGGRGGAVFGPLTCPGQYAIHRIDGGEDYRFLVDHIVTGFQFSCRAAT